MSNSLEQLGGVDHQVDSWYRVVRSINQSVVNVLQCTYIHHTWYIDNTELQIIELPTIQSFKIYRSVNE